MQVTTTKRMSIERIRLEDADFFLELLNTEPWLRYIGDRNVHNLAEARDFLRKGLLKTYEERVFGYYLAKLHDGKRIGICGFLKRPFLENVDFGFAFLPSHQSQGFGTEAGSAVLEFGIKQFQFPVLDAMTRTENAASRRLLEKLDFQFHSMMETEAGEPVMLYRRTTIVDADE